MSINWVMTSPAGDGFVKLPSERVLYTSPTRTSLDISTPNTFPGAQPFTAKSDSGIVYVTNQRIVYLPSTPTPELQSFTSPILKLHDAYVRAPFFGANYWTALCTPVPEGGIPSAHAAIELRLTFREGGAFDFHSIFEQIKERLHQAYSVARENGQHETGVVDLSAVHLEQLPAYEPAREVHREEEGPVIASPIPVRPTARDTQVAALVGPANACGSSQSASGTAAPSEPPPGYEEAQAQASGVNSDSRLRDEEAGQ